ncbi:N-terminal cleavage protein [Opitutaceae bacterium TAV5]|nr:N-terminal cleavage protein [Opitutaceae bacterium TAV5]
MKTASRYRPRQPAFAFTLIELLTVIAIVGILAAILVPTVSRVRESARTAQCSSNMRQLAQAMLLYAQDNRDLLPRTWGSPAGDTSAWWQHLYPDYCASKDVFRCTADKTTFTGNPAFTGTFTRNGKTLADGKVSYGIPGTGGSLDYKAANKPLSSFPTPSRMCLLTEFEHSDRRLSQPWFGNHPQYTSQIPFPHNGGQKGNFAFLDAHIVLMTKAQMDAASAEKKYNFGRTEPW